MYTMSETTRKNIERVTGLSMDKLKHMTMQEEKEWIENRTGKKLAFSKTKRAKIYGRGNPLLSRRKLRDENDLEKKSRKYIGF